MADASRKVAAQSWRQGLEVLTAALQHSSQHTTATILPCILLLFASLLPARHQVCVLADTGRL